MKYSCQIKRECYPEWNIQAFSFSEEVLVTYSASNTELVLRFFGQISKVSYHGA